MPSDTQLHRTFDGRLFTYDKDHNPVFEKPGTMKVRAATNTIPSRLGDAAVDPLEAAQASVKPSLSSLPGRVLAGAIPMATAGLGGALGAAGGTALAGATGGWGSVAIPAATMAGETAGWLPGAYIKDRLTHLSPGIFGTPDPNGFNANKEAQTGFINAGLSAVGRGITTTLKPGKNAVQDAYKLNDEMRAAQHADIPLTAGDVTGSSLAQKIAKPESVLNAQRDYIQAQAEDMLKGDIVAGNDAATLLQSGLKKGRENLDKTIGNRVVSLGKYATDNEVKVKGTPIRGKLLTDQGKVQYTPGPEKTVQGPINLTQSARRAASILDTSGMSTSDKTLFEGYLRANPEVGGKLKDLEKAFVKNTEGNKEISPASFETVNSLYKQLNEDIVSGKYGDITALKSMRDTLGNDIRTSMGTWKNGSAAQSEWDGLIADSVNRNKLFDQHNQIDAALKTADVKNGLSDYGLGNVANMRSVITASEFPARTKEIFRGAFLGKALEQNAGNDVTKLWDILNQRSNNAVSKELFKPDELFRIKQLGKLAERFEQGSGKSTLGDRLAYRAGTFTLGALPAAASGHDAGDRVEKGLLGGALMLTGAQMASMAARNPTVIKALIGLQDAKTAEQVAKYTRNLYEAARIAGTVAMTMPDGSTVPVRIDKKGNPVAVKQKQQPAAVQN